MEKFQTCYVCGGAGVWVEDRLAAGATSDGPPRIARCPRCHRFICEDHGEVLRLSSSGRRTFWGGQRLVCCPFDPGIPLDK